MNAIKKHSRANSSELVDVSVVICTKNAAKTIVECLKSIKKNNPKEIILVDAYSNDGTKELAQPYVTKIVEDPGLGLAMARNIGLDHTTGKYVCNVGPDNVLPKGTLKHCIDYLIRNNHVGVSTQTFMENADTSYLSHAMNLYKKARYYPGLRSVIGTPHLYITEIQKKYRFDDKMTWSDDSDLCLRLSKLGYTFGIADTFVYEIGMESTSSIRTRWKNYGRSDFEYYSKYSKDWMTKRKLWSLLHPLYSEFLLPLLSKRLKLIEKLRALPFLFFITFIRYIYWVKLAVKSKFSKRSSNN